MPKLAIFVGTACLALIAVGCIDLEQEYTINPDGSGKVVVHWIHTPFDLSGSKDPDSLLKSAVKDELTKSEGVDGWKDVTWSLRNDGKMEFKGTAYFKDVTRLKLHSQGMKGAGADLAFQKEANGLSCAVEMKKPSSGQKQGTPLSDEELKKKIKMERAKYQQSKSMLESICTDLRIRVRLNLPGKIETCSNFKKLSDASAELLLEGKTLLKAIDTLVMDDGWFSNRLREAGGLKDAAPMDDVMVEKLYGQKGPVCVMSSGGTSLFDYESEAAVARTEIAETLKKLGAAPPPTPSAKGGTFKDIKVGGVRIVYSADMERGISPLNTGERGMTVSIIGQLPGSVLAAKEGRLDKALSDAGEDLLPSDEWRRSIHFIQLTTDKTALVFDVTFDMPGENAKGIKELSGVVSYVVGEKTKDVDLGLKELKVDAEGSALGAKIMKIEPSWQEGYQKIEIQLTIAQDHIQTIRFEDEKGNALEMNASGHWSSDDQTTLTFEVKGAFPEKGRAVAVLYEDLKTYEIPFSVTNIDLLGRPLK